jgi:hypothetical protein
LFVISAAPAVLIGRGAWHRWRATTTLRSIRVEGLRDLGLATAWILLVLELFLPVDGDRLKGDLFYWTILLMAFGAAAAQLTVLAVRRWERRAEEHALRAEGLPVRRRMLSWKVVAVVCYLCLPFVGALLATAIAFPLLLIGGTTMQPIATAIGLALVGIVWVFGSIGLTLRQWRRERRADRDYWLDYRAALRRTAGAPPHEEP